MIADGAVAALERDLAALKVRLAASKAVRARVNGGAQRVTGNDIGKPSYVQSGAGTSDVESWPQARELYMYVTELESWPEAGMPASCAYCALQHRVLSRPSSPPFFISHSKEHPSLPFASLRFASHSSLITSQK